MEGNIEDTPQSACINDRQEAPVAGTDQNSETISLYQHDPYLVMNNIADGLYWQASDMNEVELIPNGNQGM